MSMSRFPIQANTRHMKMIAPMVYEVAGDGGSSASDVLFGISFTSITTTIAGYYAEKVFPNVRIYTVWSTSTSYVDMIYFLFINGIQPCDEAEQSLLMQALKTEY